MSFRIGLDENKWAKRLKGLKFRFEFNALGQFLAF